MFIETVSFFIYSIYFVFILEVDQRIDQDTIQPTMESLHGVLEPRKYCFVKQIGCGSCGKVRSLQSSHFDIRFQCRFGYYIKLI